MFKSDLIIREPNKPIINKIIVALLYASLFSYVVYLYRHKDLLNHPEKWTIIIYLVILFLILFFSSFMSIASHSIHLNFKNNKIQHQFRVGLFNYKEVWQDLVDLKYISVFKTGSYFQINMWYQKNEILNLMTLDDSEKAMENGFLISEKLDIDLLDARKAGYHKWVNKQVYKETKKVIYSD